jgi:hypothetical protein
MYDFIYNMWIMKRITAEQVRLYQAKGFITQADADKIIVSPQTE